MDYKQINPLPPLIDPSKLGTDDEIQLEYDSNGNLTRIRKVSRYEGCFVWVVILIGCALVGAYYLT